MISSLQDSGNWIFIQLGINLELDLESGSRSTWKIEGFTISNFSSQLSAALFTV